MKKHNNLVFFQDKFSDYAIEELLNLSISTSPIEGLTNTGLMEHMLSGGKKPLKNDSLLMNIAALQLKMNFETRIANNLARKTLLATYTDEIITNPINALKLLNNEESFLQKNYTISTQSNGLALFSNFLVSLGGVSSPLFTIKDNRKLYLPNAFSDEGNEFIDDYTDDTLENTGTGQKISIIYTYRY